MAKSHKIYTLIIPMDLKNKRVLLGLKRRGFGAGKFNGFGGKLEPTDPSIRTSAARELLEESCLEASERDLRLEGILLLETVADATQAILEIWVFTIHRWIGTLETTEEMQPVWFDVENNEIPYDKMWEETVKWLPGVVAKYFQPNSMEAKKREDRYFVHHVNFVGGENKETGEKMDIWHGMGESRVEWVDELQSLPFVTRT